MKSSITLLVLIFLSCFASALDVSSTINDPVLILDLDDTAKFELTINSNNNSETYNLYSLNQIELTPSQVSVDGEKSLNVTIKKTSGLQPKNPYSFTYFLKNDEEEFKEVLKIKVMNIEDLIKINSEPNDLSSNQLTFYIENTEGTTVENLNLKLSSIFFNTEETVSLGPNEKKKITVDLTEEEAKLITAGVYIINAEVETLEGTKTIQGRINIGAHSDVQTTEESSGLLIRKNVVIKQNNGNTVEDITIKIEKGIINRIFTTFNQEPNLVNRDQGSVTYTWKKQLKPGETFKLITKTNYLIPVLIILVLIAAFFVIKKFYQTKLEIKKSVKPVRTKGKEYLALRVKIQAKAKQDIENVTITDKIPNVVKIYNKFTTQKPDKIDTKNRRLQWNFGNMKSGEERVVSYVIYSKVKIIGKFTLPETKAVFEKDSQIAETQSNKVYFLTEEERRDD
jgi:hypothetical protein